MKKLLLTVTAAAVVFASTAAVWANEEIRVYRDGQEISFDVSPQIIEDRTFVPMRAIFENFGMEVDWDGNTQTVTATGNGNEIFMTVGNMSFLRNGEEITLDVPTQIVEDRTLVPVRAISESLDCEVKWDGDERKVSIISSPDKIIGTATVENMNCLIDYQPIEFVNIDGYTYLKATDLDKYGFDVTEENSDVYIKRNKNKLPLLIEEYKENKFANEKWFKPQVYPDSNSCHSIRSLDDGMYVGKNRKTSFDIFSTECIVYLDGEKTNCYNVEGEMYMQADELHRYGSVEWYSREEYNSRQEKNGFNPYRWIEPDTLIIEVALGDLELVSDVVVTGFRPSDIKDYSNYTGYATYDFYERYSLEHGICQYVDGKKNGPGYYMCFYQEIPTSIIYEAGEYENDELKNGLIISNDNGKGENLIMYEVRDFEKIQIRP